MPLILESKISSFLPSSTTSQADLCQTWSGTWTGFLPLQLNCHIFLLQVIKEIGKPKPKDALPVKNDSQLDTSGVENKENKEETNSNSFISFNPVNDGVIPGLDLVNDSERSERKDTVNGVSASISLGSNQVNGENVTTSGSGTNNVSSNVGDDLDTTDSVQKEVKALLNGEDYEEDDGFGNFDDFNNEQVAKEGGGVESAMDTNDESELNNTLSPSEPPISSADNVTATDLDSADDKTDDNLDDRLASLAKASDLLHSIAEAAAAEENELHPQSVPMVTDDAMENEVFIYLF